ncbi:MAG: hypothetical protein WBE90_01345 [Xanthobacteraceae bacterium]
MLTFYAAEERRAKKFQEIMQSLSTALGPDVDLEKEAKDAIEQWEEAAEMKMPPTEPSTPLKQLLREYHDICEEILDIPRAFYIVSARNFSAF